MCPASQPKQVLYVSDLHEQCSSHRAFVRLSCESSTPFYRVDHDRGERFVSHDLLPAQCSYGMLTQNSFGVDAKRPGFVCGPGQGSSGCRSRVLYLISLWPVVSRNPRYSVSKPIKSPIV